MSFFRRVLNCNRTSSRRSSTIDDPPPYTPDTAPVSNPKPSTVSVRAPATTIDPSSDPYVLSARAPATAIDSSSDPYEPLSTYDTLFLIDDSTSMTWFDSGSPDTRWTHTLNCLRTIAPICARYDPDGIDIYFFNSPLCATNLTSGDAVTALFSQVRPRGSTPTAEVLHRHLQNYLNTYKRNKYIKPLNVICITDGCPNSPRKLLEIVVEMARQADRLGVPKRGLGVQFVQVGRDKEAERSLEELDNELSETHGVRDMVDCVSWRRMGEDGVVSAEAVLKVVMGAIDDSLDQVWRY